jgi:uncharacterized cupin superfamily protein
MPDHKPVPQAELVDNGVGLVPKGDGWFILNVADAPAMFTEKFGGGVLFEPGIYSLFEQFGINIRVLEPGQSNAMYHREDADEAFLLLSGEAIAIIEDQEHPLTKGDFVFAPANTGHVFVGAGDQPCAILMVGSRASRHTPPYFPASPAAGKHGASVEEDTDDRGVAYGDAWASMKMKRIGVPW